MSGENGRKWITCLPYALLFWVFDKVAQAYRFSAGNDFLTKALGSMANIDRVFLQNPLPSLNTYDLTAGAVCTAVVWAVVYLRGKNGKKFRPGVEYGSARWSA